MSLQGTLKTLGITEVLEFLANREATGQLEITTEMGSATYSFVNGGVAATDYSFIRESGEDAAEATYYILAELEGSFFFDEDAQPTSTGDPESVDVVLARTAEVAERWAEVETVIPTPGHLLTRNPSLDGSVTIQPAWWDALDLIGGGATPLQLASEMQSNLLDASTMAYEMANAGLIEVSAQDPMDMGIEAPIETPVEEVVAPAAAVAPAPVVPEPVVETLAPAAVVPEPAVEAPAPVVPEPAPAPAAVVPEPVVEAPQPSVAATDPFAATPAPAESAAPESPFGTEAGAPPVPEDLGTLPPPPVAAEPQIASQDPFATPTAAAPTAMPQDISAPAPEAPLAPQPEAAPSSFVDSLAVNEVAPQAPAPATPATPAAPVGENDGWVSNDRTSFNSAPAAPAAPQPAPVQQPVPEAFPSPYTEGAMSSEALAGQVIDDLGSVDATFPSPPVDIAPAADANWAMDETFGVPSAPAPAAPAPPAADPLGSVAGMIEDESDAGRGSVMNFLRRE